MSKKTAKKEHKGVPAPMFEAMDPGVLASDKLCGHRGCFANHGGLCDILNNTDFGGKRCSFFKTQKQYEDDLARYTREKDGTDKGDDFLAQNAGLMEELQAMEKEAKELSDKKTAAVSQEFEASDDNDGWDSEDDEGGGGDGE
ncbi:MAG: hypothetical protein BACD_00170 [Bacteroides rodentium]